ncbi:MAG: hypothetical protein Q8M92_08520, partial [Candidatus Subteraquimicrobiales bacterium]|nr:hypothetical protein [Candidatus Subteraquimicrobiales bacterium]
RDYWVLCIDERDMLLRRSACGELCLVPEGELVAYGGGIVYRVHSELRGLGIGLDYLMGIGMGVFGFFDRSSYSDVWLRVSWSRCLVSGGMVGLLGILREHGLGEELLVELRGGYLYDEVEVVSSVELGLLVSEWSEVDWYREVGLLLEDARLSGDRGYNVRKELLLMIGKKKGYLSSDVGDGAIGAFVAGLSMRALGVLDKIDVGLLVKGVAVEVD